MMLTALGTFLLIFALRIANVALGTARQIIVIRGQKYLGAVLGFFEVLIFIVAISKVLNDSNWSDTLAYCLGFSVGTILGAILEEKMALGYSGIRIFTQERSSEIVDGLRKHGFGVTTITGEGRDGTVSVLEVVVQRKDVSAVRQQVQDIDQKAFITIEQPIGVQHGHFWKKHLP